MIIPDPRFGESARYHHRVPWTLFGVPQALLRDSGATLRCPKLQLAAV